MNKQVHYNREDHIRKRINEFFSLNFSLPEDDYYAKLNPKAILSLKSALSDINNMLTLKLTISFAEWVSLKFGLDESAIQAIYKIIHESKPSTNGYDIWLGYPITFVGEVKCNIPINGGSVYGSAQRIGIEKDISGLLNGKRKAPLNPVSCLKFMVFLDTQEVRKANEHLQRVSSLCKEKLIFQQNHESLDRVDIVYGVYISLGS